MLHYFIQIEGQHIYNIKIARNHKIAFSGDPLGNVEKINYIFWVTVRKRCYAQVVCHILLMEWDERGSTKAMLWASHDL